MTKGRLEGKTALVTGGAQGIGLSIAKLFLHEGATVIVSDINDSLGKLVVEEGGDKASYLHLDVGQEGDWKKAFAHIEARFTKLEILVNNAGITGLSEEFGKQDPEHTSLESWHAVHAVNADGVFLGCKYAIQSMKKTGGGSIINISSRSGLIGIPGAAAYASSKASVRNHTKSVAPLLL